MNAYEAKQEARRERLENASDKAADMSARHYQASHAIVGQIPMGQPILVGHHSEARHRSDLARSDAHMRKAIEEDNKAKLLARKAKAVGSGGISSDDPDAIAKLETELTKLEASQSKMIAANKLARKGDKAGLAALGYSERMISNLLTPEFGKVGFPDYATKNNAANIRRIKGRIEELKAKASAPVREAIEGEGFRIVDDPEINRTCVEFDAMPSADVRIELKRCGFHWNHYRDAWTRMSSEQAWYHAQRITAML